MFRMIAMAVGIAALTLPFSPQFNRIGRMLSSFAAPAGARTVALASLRVGRQFAAGVSGEAEGPACREAPRPRC